MMSRPSARISLGLFAVVQGLALAVAPSVQAQVQDEGWRYSRWGMTSQQVKAASAGEVDRAAPLIDSGAGRQELRTRTRAMNAEFSLTFGFRSGRLSDVTLTPFDMTLCPRVRMEIEAARGMPQTTVNQAGGILARWADDLTAAWVELEERGADDIACRVTYRPR